MQRLAGITRSRWASSPTRARPSMLFWTRSPPTAAGDIPRLGYILLAQSPVYEPRTFLHPAGFVAMGHGIPAALGAKAAFPERIVVAVLGDGCFLMSGMELATAVQEKLPIIVIL